MRFLIDMPLSPELAVWLTQHGYDAIHISALGLSRASDVVILGRALDEKRAIVTADLDYARLLALTQDEGPGLILFRGGSYGEQEAVERLGRVLKVVPEEELPKSVVVIEKGRIRRRRLPLG